MQYSSELNWHCLSVQETLKRLDVDIQTGLNSQQVKFRHKYFGYNVLPKKIKLHFIKIFLTQFKNSLIYVLLFAALVSFVAAEYVNGVLIVAVLISNALIGGIQEYKAEQNATNLNNLISLKARVRRNGYVVLIDASELVIGDIVILNAGNKSPADLRVIEAKQLMVNESFITGESISVSKTTGILKNELSLGDRINLVYSGSQITFGYALGVVVAIGNMTQIGMIARTILHEKQSLPPLVVRMEKFTQYLAFIIVGLCGVFATVALFKGFHWYKVLLISIALAVSAIPEGLPIAITVALSIASKRMFKRNVLVRKLVAVEGLGSCNVIASDKTGTLTVNRQIIKRILSPNGDIFEVSGDGYNDQGKITSINDSINIKSCISLQQLVLAGCVANEAELYFLEKTHLWEYNGDEVDLAFLTLGLKLGIFPKLKTQLSGCELIPYDSEQKFSGMICNYAEKRWLFIKGAPEVVLARSVFMLNNDNHLISLQQNIIEGQLHELSSQGYRVLALAGKYLPTSVYDNDLIFYGLVGLIDPLRHESLSAIKECQRAGIQVCMVTGDHPQTALAIARQLGIAKDASQVISGHEFEKLYNQFPNDFHEKLKSIQVFARVSPLQKMHIIEAIHKLGNFVAVTGDGVNDVPALKKANISISMGSGSDLTKDNADLIIIDDNFNSIVAGVEEGRYAYDNIRKVTYLLVSCAFLEIFLLLMSVIAGLPLPLTAIQLLWINMITNGMQDVALAFEAGEQESMQVPPRKPKESIFNRLMIEESMISGLTGGIICFSLWFLMLNAGYTEVHSRTLLFLSVVLIENVQIFNCRSERRSVFRVPLKNNYFVIFVVIVSQLLQLTVSHIPFMQRVLDSDPVNVYEWFLLLGLSLILILVMEIYKYFKFAVRNNFGFPTFL